MKILPLKIIWKVKVFVMWPIENNHSAVTNSMGTNFSKPILIKR